MILSITAALLIQAAPLAADQSAAATTCVAAMLTSGSPRNLDFVMAFNYLSIAAASNSKDEKLHVGMARARSVAKSQAAKGVKGHAELTNACRARFPRAWSISADLPRDSFQRRYLCRLVSMLYDELLSEFPEMKGVAAELTTVRARRFHFGSLLTAADEAKHRLYGHSKGYAMAEDAIRKSVAYGNVRALYHACDAAFRA